MKGLVIFGIVLILILHSCSNIYNEHQKIKDLKWNRNDIKTFEVDIENDGEYDLFFAMRHTIGYPFTTIKINIEYINPKTYKSFIKTAEFPVTDENGKYIGDVSGQLWDIESSFAEKMFLKKGKHIFKVSHAMNYNPVILLVDIGLVVKKSSE